MACVGGLDPAKQLSLILAPLLYGLLLWEHSQSIR